VKLFVRAWLIWTIVWAVLMIVMFVASEGEPVCTGPLIVDVDTSDPPQCNDPIEGFTAGGPLLFVVGIAVTSIVVASWTVIGSLRRTHD